MSSSLCWRNQSTPLNHLYSFVFKVRKRSAQLTSVEGHLDSKVAEVTDHMARVAELEEDLAKKASQMQWMKAELDERNQTRAQSEALAEKMRALHGEQCQEMEAQIDMVSRLLHYEVTRKNGHYYRNDILKCIFLTENV